MREKNPTLQGLTKLVCEPLRIGGENAADGYEFPDQAVSTDSLTYTPFITQDCQAGLVVRDHSTDAREEFIYFNPSDDDYESGPNTFVYQGGEADPVDDEPLHFYRTAIGWED